MAKRKKKAAVPRKVKDSPPDVLLYDVYTEYLKDYFEYRKEKDSGFSFRSIASRIGVSYAHVQKLITGKKKFSEDSLEKLVKLIGLIRYRKVYFSLLVESGTAMHMKVEATERGAEALPTMIVYEMVNLKGFRPDPHWVSARVNNMITADQARESLKELIRNEFIKQSGRGWVHHGGRKVLYSKKPIKDIPAQILKLTSDFLAPERLSRIYTCSLPVESEKVMKLYDEFLKKLIDMENKSGRSGKSEHMYGFTIAMGKMTREVSRGSYL